jgi:hypothetical protein
MGVILVVILACAWFFIRSFQNSGAAGGIAGLINSDYENFRNLAPFDEDTVKAAQKRISGYWIYAEGDTAKSPVAKREYMEVIDNGIIWQVTDWYINTPSGGSHKITRVHTGYVAPFSYSRDGGAYVCEMRVIRQAYIADGDTCYGASQVDDMWLVFRGVGDTVLTVNQRDYALYTGDIKEFFPEGVSLGIVDKVTLGACGAASSLQFYSKRALGGSLNAVPFFARAQAVDSLVRVYYKPIVFDEMVRKYDPRSVSDELDVRLTLSPEGELTDVKRKPSNMLTKRFDDRAAAEIRSWLFPAVGDTDDPQKIKLTVKVR